MSKRKKPTVKPSDNNPAGPVDKTAETERFPGVSDDTRVIFGSENNRDD